MDERDQNIITLMDLEGLLPGQLSRLTELMEMTDTELRGELEIRARPKRTEF